MSSRIRIAWCLILASVLATIALPRIRIDNSLERWVDPETESQARYERFLETFGSDEFVLVALSSARLLEPEVLHLLVEYASDVERFGGVASVEGLPVLYRDYFSSSNLEGLRRELSVGSFDDAFALSDDGTATGLLIGVSPTENEADRRALLDALRARSSELELHGVRCAFVGSTVLMDSLDALSSREATRSFALAFMTSLATLLLLFRAWRPMLIAALSAAIPVVITLGFMALVGRSLNMITSVLPALLWVLSLSGAIHLLVRYLKESTEESLIPNALDHAISQVSRPLTLASLTTASGFLSLLLARMQPVQELGIFAALGILLSLAVNLTVGPLLIHILRPHWSGDLRLPLLRWGLRWPRAVLAVTIALVLVGLATIPNLRIASNPLTFLPPDHQTVRDFEFVQDELGGFYTHETVLDLPVHWTDPSVWPVIQGLCDRIGESDVVSRVRSPLEVLAVARRILGEGRSLVLTEDGTAEEAAALVVLVSTIEPSLLPRFVDASGRRIRISAIVNEMDENRFLDLVTATRALISELPDAYEAHVTGQVLQLVDAQKTLVSSQIRSLAVAWLIILVAIGVGLASLRMTLHSILPNLLPVLASFSCMVLFDLALDAGTVMVASVALGIAVDDTVHLLTEVNRARRSPHSSEPRLGSSVQRVESAMLLTTITAALGFFALSTSTFMPIRYFGLLSGISMIVALLADLVVVPAILTIAESGTEVQLPAEASDRGSG